MGDININPGGGLRFVFVEANLPVKEHEKNVGPKKMMAKPYLPSVCDNVIDEVCNPYGDH